MKNINFYSCSFIVVAGLFHDFRDLLQKKALQNFYLQGFKEKLLYFQIYS